MNLLLVFARGGGRPGGKQGKESEREWQRKKGRNCVNVRVPMHKFIFSSQTTFCFAIWIIPFCFMIPVSGNTALKPALLLRDL